MSGWRGWHGRWATADRIPPLSTISPPDHLPDLSVVICTHNGAGGLPTALGSLGRQSLSSERYELIVIDDGSRDHSAQVAESCGARVVRLSPNRGLAGARNAGVAAARGEIVAFTDDDCRVDGGWLSALLDAFDDPAVDAVGGRVLPGGPDGFILRYLTARNPLVPLSAELLEAGGARDRLRRYLRGVVGGERPLAAGDPLYSVVGANMAFRRRRIAEWGGFDEAFRFGGEEEDLCRRAHARASGARVIYQPSARVVHRFEPSLRDTLRRSRAYGRGNARAALKHEDVRLIIYPFPLLWLGVVAGGALTRRSSLALLGMLGPLLTYPRWLAEISGPPSMQALSYPYVQLAQELSTMRGEIDGYRAGYEPVAAGQPADDSAGGIMMPGQTVPIVRPAK